jgi:hypothetical protein
MPLSLRQFMNRCVTSLAVLWLSTLTVPGHCGESVTTDILIVGGTESGWAAAIQAARMGVESITIVHDGRLLGGQYTEQGLACVDESKGVGQVGWGPEWHPVKRSFHRFGLFKELMDRIEAFNARKYGSPMPGRPMHGPTTFRPAEAELIFREMLQPYLDRGQVVLRTEFLPVRALLSNDGQRLTGVVFASRAEASPSLTVMAKLTLDASDWGDVVQLSGAAFEVGPDPRERYGEPSAQADVSLNPPNEMNPITWTMIVEQSDDQAAIPEPPHYDVRRYLRATPAGRSAASSLTWDRKVPGNKGLTPWPAAGKESGRQPSILTMRRIVDGVTSTEHVTSALLCYANGQDYPLERLPRHVAEALEATETGASLKNLILMTPAQREIIFEDARAHSLGLLHHLQTYVHDRTQDTANSLRHYRLSDEFGAPDRLPPKPYIRESLRLKALYMMREQDSLNALPGSTTKPFEAFASAMYPDGVFSWQFPYDFHDTGRAYLKSEGDAGPWTHCEKPGRGAHTLSDRGLFPLRSLIPAHVEGLIGAQGNVGFSSIVSSAVRLHDHRLYIGQAAAALAAVCLKTNEAPREVVWDRTRFEEIQHALCGGSEGAPMLLWPYRDLPADHPAFVAINRLAARGLLPVQRLKVDFNPDAVAAPEWRAAVLRLCGDQVDIRGVASDATRGEFAQHVWSLVQSAPPAAWPRLAPGDADADGQADHLDPLPFLPHHDYWQQFDASAAHK